MKTGYEKFYYTVVKKNAKLRIFGEKLEGIKYGTKST